VERSRCGDRRGTDEGSAFLTDVVVLILAGHSPSALQTVAWWVGVAVAAGVTIAFVLTYRGITVASALARRVSDLSADMSDSSPDPGATLSPGRAPAIDHRRRFSRAVVGVREYQGQLVAVIAVDGDVRPQRSRAGAVQTDNSGLSQNTYFLHDVNRLTDC
jgi:type VII secretion protein EccE